MTVVPGVSTHSDETYYPATPSFWFSQIQNHSTSQNIMSLSGSGAPFLRLLGLKYGRNVDTPTAVYIF